MNEPTSATTTTTGTMWMCHIHIQKLFNRVADDDDDDDDDAEHGHMALASRMDGQGSAATPE